ncbi:LLM class oxidoreductase [Ruegeria sp. EL01]|jgi:luciferase-type oxidoreductase|uniref:LLM class oxidoreductase n=1 Tax=Ruegeria sp. EL01 TaxID=2107578 RepID=UPI000EA818E9|nr:LLM class oxidoreductase [Ruegeria sp. EL01]
MLDTTQQETFPIINRAYNSVFQKDKLTVGLVAPLEAYADSATPTMRDQLDRIKLAEELGFAAVWLRDVPFNVPSFGDAGQIFDPWVYLGMLAGQTQSIALGLASAVLPLRHPAHVAKAAASVDVLSGGRMLLGVASGDRPDEYPALDMSFGDRADRFREAFAYIREMAKDRPVHQGGHGALDGSIDMLPKPSGARLPMLVTGGSQQSPDWIARNGDGWMLYPRDTATQAKIISDWRARTVDAGRDEQPVMQPLYVDLVEDHHAPQPIHLGLRLNAHDLVAYLKSLEGIGVNHVALNLRFNQADIATTLKRLAEDVLPNLTI